MPVIALKGPWTNGVPLVCWFVGMPGLTVIQQSEAHLLPSFSVNWHCGGSETDTLVDTCWYRVLQKKPSTKKFQHAPGAPINVANHHFSTAGARMAFFHKARRSTAFTQHWNWETRGVQLSSLEFKLVGCSCWRTRYVLVIDQENIGIQTVNLWIWQLERQNRSLGEMKRQKGFKLRR